MTKITSDAPINTNVTTSNPLSDKPQDTKLFKEIEIVPFAGDKKFGLDLNSNLNRARLEGKYQTHEQNKENDGNIRGITTETPFRKEVGETETQESVLRRTFEEMAFKAGISDVKLEGQEQSPKEMFIEERMANNKAENGDKEHRIFYKDSNSDTPQTFSDDDWVNRQKAGTITMYPTSDDITALKDFKASSDYNEGVRTADKVLQSLEQYEQWSLSNLTGFTNPKEDLQKALRFLDLNGTNGNFQEGFINKLGAEKFLQLEKVFADNPSYNLTISNSLAKATKNVDNTDAILVGESQTKLIEKEIAQKADIETLARLTKNKFTPQSSDFLVEAGKRAMTQDVGWVTRAGGGAGFGVPVKITVYNEGTQEVLKSIARDPQASLELLQDAEFVKNAMKLENSGENLDTISQIIRSGMSKEMQASNPEKADNAIRTMIEMIKNPDLIKGTSKTGLRESDEIISERTAKTLADVYANNIETFSTASGRSSGDDKILDVKDTRAFLKALQPYGAVKDENGVTINDKLAIVTAVKYNELLAEAEKTGNPKSAERAANLASAFIDAKNQSNLGEAKEAEARREQLAVAIGIITGVGMGNMAKSAGVSNLTADLIGKISKEMGEGTISSSNVDDALEMNRDTLEKQQGSNKVALVNTYEQAAFERTNGTQTATPEAKAKAKEFLNDLKEYNDSLPAASKILDSNGRLINPLKMTGEQKASLEDIFSGKTNTAGDRLSNQMRAIYNELLNATERQVKGL